MGGRAALPERIFFLNICSYLNSWSPFAQASKGASSCPPPEASHCSSQLRARYLATGESQTLLLVQIKPHLRQSRASLVAQMGKSLPAVRETEFNPWVGKIPWRRKWQTTPVFLTWKIPWIEEPGGLQSMGSQRVGHD